MTSDELGPRLLKALEDTSSACRAVDNLSGRMDECGNHLLFDLRADLSYAVRRLATLCAMHGVPEQTIRTAKQLNEGDALPLAEAV